MKRIILFIGIILSITTILSFNTINTPPYKSLCDTANAKNKNIIVYFSGSDWCANCNKFKKEVLNTPDIKKSIETDYVYHLADFPQRTELTEELETLNNSLAEKLNNQGVFPLLVITDKNLTIKKVINLSSNVDETLKSLKFNR
ncbi:thioredoxin family protein [Tenacibaculum finnmarkense]|uniref:Thioredoxin fold domain-containing protein n=1 Tax=Tenacibaculum finnmarkense genomovar finnmarkense TaxID=1458503 RepID=A0AAP1RDT2_9FLAO|nr:thioredoxin family protein [Tenacibaculum finnmarkense]MBE7651840.1 thioredoxin fold domain-containing protein [Tenacibaculum finnmarkense genomovar finnmarkense]MBE7694445.1 thioredoxin fold domain-containing protein [Tenacibaculum finnmarkense genomovar finnmarkense]MCD8426055.1 thioredoxin family protein [Tenacibaculum finnmarkense genomovar finnmarkense]MCG8729849.1 thioredoxin fold domain-containing protein [Tenacibaculum finnmarkense]MCG8751868.1 thioredoxin fold domain-containing pro